MTDGRARRTFTVGVASMALAATCLTARAQTPATSAAPPPSDRARLTQSPPDRDPSFASVYSHFFQTYKLAADDVIAVRIVGQPDYSLESIKVSPLGRIYHPLLGDVEVAGITIPQLTTRLEQEFAEYFKSPQVSVDLVVASSAKIGVLGEVGQPGIVVMERPMTILDAITASGGFTDFGARTNVTLLRPAGDGSLKTTEVDMKRVMEGKGKAGENPTLAAGDTIIVHGNKKKAVHTFMSLAGLGAFVNYVRLGQIMTGN